MSDASQGQGAGQPDSGQADPFEGYDDFTKEYINQHVPEEHRASVAPYFKNWNGQVTRAFQERAAQLQQYQGIDPQRARAALEFADNFRLNPQQTLSMLAQGGHLKPEHLAAVREHFEAQQEGPASGNGNPDLEAAITKHLGPVQSALAGIVEQNKRLQEAERNREQQAAYDKLVSEMKKQYGDKFNENYVLRGMAAGLDPHASQKEWEETLNAALQARQAPRAPFSMAANGQTPKPQTDYSKLDDKQTDDLVADMLRNLQGGQ